MDYEKKFLSLGDEIPPVSPSVPAGCNFVLYKRVGKLLTLSGYGPFWGADVPVEFSGKLGKELTTKQGYAASRLTCINLLLMARQAITTLDNVIEIVEVNGMVNCTPDFTEQPGVINGCSDLLVQIFGDAGRHTRAAVGMNSLAFNISVEIAISLLVKAQ
jgi:enamine deaminase RidA (YjgF/YER057c/UK114 family)